ncbi:MAG: coiled coil domain-containing protein [Gammaproteobacteria bacterium]|jgi:uncharacterized coiled-coil DUF342 family protein
MSEKHAYEKKLQAQLDEWSAEIDRLKAKADALEADAQIEYNQRIDDLVAMRKAADERLEELRNASDDAWEDLKAGADEAWSSLEKAFLSARSRF